MTALDPTGEEDERASRHILRELGFVTRRVGDELQGTATVTPALLVPGLPHLRTSILFTWADTMGGLLAIRSFSPRVPVTLELDVHLLRPAPGAGEVRGVASVAKAGRSVFVFEAAFSDGDGDVALAAGSFMASPDPGVRMPARLPEPAPPTQLLEVPLAQRVGCVRRAPGEAVLPRSEEGLNSSNTVNGGLIALAAEEAVLSRFPGTTVCSLALRYLQPVRVGPAVATAEVREGLGQVRIRDAGSDDRLCVLATTRTFPDPRAQA
ncbi:MAG TPA: hotdog domain-containing protein [Acidimicrobiales bacterium]|nr:hotdog domain-containing protein [Acidimicrobiales bacterium]